MILCSAVLGGVRWIEERPPSTTDNACVMFSEKPSWYRAARDSEQRWDVDLAVQLAIVHRESGFVSDARPPREGFLIFPGFRPSSAVGYAQAIDSTWQEYRRRAQRPRADRERFSDAIDFVGWYCSVLSEAIGAAKNDAFSLYLGYHEGPSGYRSGAYRNKSQLLEAASKVDARSRRYREQLIGCVDRLESRARWRGAVRLAMMSLVGLGILEMIRRRWSNSAKPGFLGFVLKR